MKSTASRNPDEQPGQKDDEQEDADVEQQAQCLVTSISLPPRRLLPSTSLSLFESRRVFGTSGLLQ
jgi:hypothetical protein